MIRTTVLTLGLVTALHAGTAMAAGFGVSAQAGTLGAGIQAGVGLGKNFGLRLNANTFSYDYDKTENDIDYETTLDLQSIGLLADWYPFGGTFRLTAGVYNNGNEFNLTAKPNGDTYTIDGNTYNTSDIGSLTGNISYDKSIAPYVGLGWGHLGGKSGFTFTIDIGVVMTGASTVNLTANCTNPNPAVCTQLESDLEAEEADVQDAANDIKIHPVLSLGVGYTF